MLRAFIVLLLLVALCACAPGPQATPAPTATISEALLQEAVQKTLTAMAPTATPMPKDTPTPTATVTPTATPTSIPVEIPEGWKTYTSIADVFTVAYPPQWTPADEKASYVHFKISDRAGLSLDVQDARCGVGSSSDAQKILNCLVTEAAQIDSIMGDFKLVSKTEWDDGVYKGYMIQSTVHESVLKSTSVQVRVVVPLSQDKMLYAMFFHITEPELSAQEQDIIAKMIRSFRLK